MEFRVTLLSVREPMASSVESCIARAQASSELRARVLYTFLIFWMWAAFAVAFDIQGWEILD